MLRRLEDLDQAVALGVDTVRVSLQRLGGRDGVFGGGDVVGANDIDNVDVLARANAFGLAGGAQQAVGGALALGVGAARRADNGGAVLLEAGTVSLLVQAPPEHHGLDKHDNVLGNVDSKLADAGAAKLLHHPIAAAGQVLFLLVRY